MSIKSFINFLFRIQFIIIFVKLFCKLLWNIYVIYYAFNLNLFLINENDLKYFSLRANITTLENMYVSECISVPRHIYKEIEKLYDMLIEYLEKDYLKDETIDNKLYEKLHIKQSKNIKIDSNYWISFF